jgi:hypothetical protein
MYHNEENKTNYFFCSHYAVYLFYLAMVLFASLVCWKMNVKIVL